MKRIIIAIVIALVIFGGSGYWAGYSIGYAAGNSEGWEKGTVYGNNTGYEKGYSLGYDNGKEYVVSHLDQYVIVPKAVSYSEVVAFIKSDQTDENEYSLENFDCTTFATMLKINANMVGIKCAVVSFDMYNIKTLVKSGHAINCFGTTDQGIVYFDPQTDGERYGIYVGGIYTLSGIIYKITKVDIIW